METIKVGRRDVTPNKKNSSVDSSKRKAELQLVADNNKKQSYVSDFEYFGPEMPNDYSPHSIHSIFKDCLPLHEQNTPNR